MIPSELQAFSFKNGSSTFVPAQASMKGMGENLDQTFGKRLAYFQEKYEAFSPQKGVQSSQDPFGKGEANGHAFLEVLSEWMPSLTEPEPFFEDIDWEMAMIMAEEALSEATGMSSSFDLGDREASFMEAAIPIEEMIELVSSKSEQASIVSESAEAIAFIEEMWASGLSPLMALFVLVAEKGEDAKPIREQLSQFVRPLHPVAGRKDGSPSDRDVSNHTKEVGKPTQVVSRHYRLEPLHAAVKMKTILPNVTHGTSPPSAFVFNETMAMQALNQGEQLTIHIGDQKTEHARMIAFMKQFQHALRKGHLRSDGGGRQQLTIRLYPESLGRLDVQITRANGVLQARLVTTTAMARELVESQLPSLRNAFHQQQLPVERIIVDEAHPEIADERKEGQHSNEEDASAYEEEKSDEERGGEHLPSFEEWLEATLNQET